MKQQTFCSQHLWNGKGWPERLRPLLSLSTSSPCGLLGYLSQGMATFKFGQNISLNQNSQQKLELVVAFDVHWIMVNNTQLGTELEI